MDNDKKILEILEIIQQDISELKQDVGGLKQDVGGLKSDVSSLKLGQQSLEKGQSEIILRLDRIEGTINDLEPRNASRHIDIWQKIDNMSASLTTVEAVTGKNMQDIAHLKAIK